jgi:hypothetical protein
VPFVTSEKHRDYCRRYRREHREEIRLSNLKYRESHRDSTREYQKKYFSSHREKVMAAISAWKKKSKEKMAAHKILSRAIASGEVVRPARCSCGNPNPLGHHEDYSKPLDVKWLCPSCHKKLHYSMTLALDNSGDL